MHGAKPLPSMRVWRDLLWGAVARASRSVRTAAHLELNAVFGRVWNLGHARQATLDGRLSGTPWRQVYGKADKRLSPATRLPPRRARPRQHPPVRGVDGVAAGSTPRATSPSGPPAGARATAACSCSPAPSGRVRRRPRAGCWPRARAGPTSVAASTSSAATSTPGPPPWARRVGPLRRAPRHDHHDEPAPPAPAERPGDRADGVPRDVRRAPVRSGVRGERCVDRGERPEPPHAAAGPWRRSGGTLTGPGRQCGRRSRRVKRRMRRCRQAMRRGGTRWKRVLRKYHGQVWPRF